MGTSLRSRQEATSSGSRSVWLCRASSTLRSAIDRGFNCLTVRDACGSAHADLHAAALAMIEVEGGIFGECCDSQALLMRLREAA